MESEMVERVARVLCASNGLGDAGEVFIATNWPRYAGQARAAIEAMREPTEAMISAGADAVWYGTEQLPRAMQEATMAVGFPAMIDAALNHEAHARTEPSPQRDG